MISKAKAGRLFAMILAPLVLAAPRALAQEAPAVAAADAEMAVVDGSQDPARMAAASALMDILIPPGGEAEWAASFISPAMDNGFAAMTESTEFKQMIESAPRARAVVERFMARVRSSTLDTASSELPALRNAMTAAHARQFSVAQIAEITAFMRTPTGYAYHQASPNLLTDVDVARWQRTVMEQTQEALAPVLQQFITEIAEVAAKADSPTPAE